MVEAICKSPLVHYVGVAVVSLSIGTSVSIGRSTSFSLGSGENTINLSQDAKRVQRELKQTQDIINETKIIIQE